MDESDTYELAGTLENARYWHKRAEKARAEVERLRAALEEIETVAHVDHRSPHIVVTRMVGIARAALTQEEEE